MNSMMRTKTTKQLSVFTIRLRHPERRSALVLGLLLIALLSVSVPAASAQGQIQVEQFVVTQYGQSLTFSAHLITPIVLKGAYLTIQVLNRETPFTVTVPINNQIDVLQTVSVNELDLPPAATLTYFWEFEDQASQLLRADAATVRYADNQVPWEWDTHQQDNVTVFTVPDETAVAKAALEIAETSLASAGRTIGKPVANPITIYVYPTLAPMASSLRAHHRVVEDWVAAYAIPDQMTILVSAAPGPDMLVNLKRDLPHEIMHLAIYSTVRSQPNTFPGWLNEGLALNTSAEPDPTLDEVLHQATSKRIMLSLNTLCASNFSTMPAHDAALAYAQSASVVHYIAERYGASQLSALVAAYTNGLSCDEGVRLALGISLSELENQWLRNLASTRADTVSQDDTSLSYFVVWIMSLLLALLFIAPQPSHNLRPLFDTRASLPKVPSDEPTAQS